MYMEVMVAFTVLVSFVCGVFSYVVIKPLNTAITQLNNAVDELDQLVKNIDLREHEFDKRLTLAETSIKAFHRRLDALVDFCKDTHRNDASDGGYRVIRSGVPRHHDPQSFINSTVGDGIDDD